VAAPPSRTSPVAATMSFLVMNDFTVVPCWVVRVAKSSDRG
jgi:hypothetical protein